MKNWSRAFAVTSLFIASLSLVSCGTDNSQDPKTSNVVAPQKVLIFTKTAGWRHKSIEPGREALKQALLSKGIEVVVSEDATLFTDQTLSEMSALVFLNTTGDILNEAQQVAMERYIQAGGGFVGIHAATDTEWKGDWIWYRRLVGGVFASHPNTPSNVQTARIQVMDKTHPSTAHLPDNFLMADEWYDFKSLSNRRIDIMKVDETTYSGGGHGEYHPIAWYHEFDGGRAFYTGIGHNADNFNEPLYTQHLLGAVEYAIGANKRDYALSRPEPNRFVKETLLDNLNEPVSLDIAKDGSGVIYVERKGQVNWFDLKTNELSKLGKVDIFSAKGFGEFGLLTVALDPDFAVNQHLYMMYNLPSEKENTGPLQRVSRFTLVNGKIDHSLTVDMLDTPNEDTCCHTGGNMEFDGQGNLFIALGDNTNPFEAFGVGPADFRDGRAAHDAYRTSGNTQDLRGKILRITPQADGSYTIPEGNLFSNADDGRPEIYVMGTRNPYTIAFDDKEQTLYYGDVGPDAKGDDELHGSKGFDEVNRVRKAGNFGWPLFIGNNKAYRQFDYAKKKEGKWNNPLAPINTSPRNTGLKALPPAQPAFIWYPYKGSDQFPELGAGSRNALVAGVYRTKQDKAALPAYYEGGLFISDFMRRWVKVVFTDDNGDIYKIDKFAENSEFAAPIDITFSHQGQLYILEYGSKWHDNNEDARLSRIVYTGPGNRKPIAKVQATNTQGVAPLSVKVSASQSSDPDNNPLTYEWRMAKLSAEQTLEQADFSQAKVTKELSTELLFDHNGKYAVQLTVIDSEGESSSALQLVEVGNAPPTIEIKLAGNQDFIWPNKADHQYEVVIHDNEDGVINQDSAAFGRVSIGFNKINDTPAAQAVGHLAQDPLGPGRAAAKKRLCVGCHQEQDASVGPSFQSVADKYKSLEKPVEYLASSIAAGSTGKWGQHQMPAHDFLSNEERTQLAEYILLLKSKAPSLPLTGKLPEVKAQGSYQLVAEYTDEGSNNISAITTKQTYTLREPVLLAESLFANANGAKGLVLSGADTKSVVMSGERVSLPLGEFDLTGVRAIKIEQKYLDWLPAESVFEIRVGKANGKLLAKGQFDYNKLENWQDVQLELGIELMRNKTPLVVVVKTPDTKPETAVAHIYSVSFIRKD
ncbi:ThuA domain-containing protein [Paraglaciecola sp.]|uniref:ThuA domain-containing protein n=1 Tax=Paraglaciecola sp. TaxID=1920173 RepID=UPI003EF2A3FB